MHKKTLGAAASAATLAAMLAGVSSPAAAASVTTFTYWTSGFSTQEISTLDTAFHKAYPQYQASGQYITKSDEYLPKVIAALKSGTYPTVMTDQNPSDLPLIETSGKLVPLNGKLTGLTNHLYPGIKASLFYRGKQLGMALSGVGDIALFYNKTDFAQAGIKTPPKTWAQVAADAKKLTDPSAHRWGFYVPLGDAEWISYDWEPVLWGQGGSLLNTNQNRATFDSAAGVAALSTWANMIKNKVAPATSFASGGNFDGPSAFSSNAVAMITDGPWLEGEVKNIDYGVAPYPAGSKGPSTNLGIGVVALLKKTPAEDAAGLAFIKFLASPKEGAYLADQNGGLPDSPAQISQPLLKANEAKKWYNVFAGLEKYGQVRPITPLYNAISQDLWTGVNEALTGKMSPSQALATAQKQADQVLAKGA